LWVCLLWSNSLLPERRACGAIPFTKRIV
jgi:hypothetical protein